MSSYYNYFIIIFPIFIVMLFIVNKYFLTSKYHKYSLGTMKYPMNGLQSEEVFYKKIVKFGKYRSGIGYYRNVELWGFAKIRICKSGILINPIDSKKFELFYSDLLKIEVTDGYGIYKNKSKIDLFYIYDEKNPVPMLVRTKDDLILTLKSVCSCEILKFEQLYSGKDDWLIR